MIKMKKYSLLFLLGLLFLAEFSQAQTNIPFERAFDSTLVIKRLPENINTDYEELAPILSGDGNTLFFIRVGDPKNVGGAGKIAVDGRDSVATNQDIWISHKVNGEWQKAVNLGPTINDDKSNIICGTNKDGSIIYISNQYEKKGDRFKLNPGVTLAKRISDTNWEILDTIPVVFRKNLNHVDRESHFYFHVVDDSTLLVSKHSTKPRHGNVGEEDIYIYKKELFDEKKKEYVYTYRNRLGLVLSEEAEFETAPFLSGNQQTLYFSQGSHENSKTYSEIYEISRKGAGLENWTSPREALSQRNYINKSAINEGDFNAYLVMEEGKNYKGYFASNRDATADTKTADLYTFDVISKPNPVSLTVKTFDAQTRKPLATSISVSINGKAATQKFQQKDSVFNVFVTEAGNYQIMADGTSGFQGYTYQPADSSIDIQFRKAYELPIYLPPTLTGGGTKAEVAFDTVYFAFDRYDKPFYAPVVTSFQNNYATDTVDANNGRGDENALWTIENSFLSGLGAFNWLARVPKKTDLSWENDPIFGDIIKFLKEHKELDITITGYADSIGTVQNNLRLADRRCTTVRQILVNAGFDQRRIQDINFKPIPKGETDQILLDEQPDLARALSRRVVIQIVPRREEQ